MVSQTVFRNLFCCGEWSELRFLRLETPSVVREGALGLPVQLEVISSDTVLVSVPPVSFRSLNTRFTWILVGRAGPCSRPGYFVPLP